MCETLPIIRFNQNEVVAKLQDKHLIVSLSKATLSRREPDVPRRPATAPALSDTIKWTPVVVRKCKC